MGDACFTTATGGSGASFWRRDDGALRSFAACRTHALQKRPGVAEDGEGGGGRSVNGARTREAGSRLVPAPLGAGTLAAARGLAAPS